MRVAAVYDVQQDRLYQGNVLYYTDKNTCILSHEVIILIEEILRKANLGMQGILQMMLQKPTIVTRWF